jgi:hypothetical protein
MHFSFVIVKNFIIYGTHDDDTCLWKAPFVGVHGQLQNALGI